MHCHFHACIQGNAKLLWQQPVNSFCLCKNRSPWCHSIWSMASSAMYGDFGRARLPLDRESCALLSESSGDLDELTSIRYQLLLMQPQNVGADIVHEVLHTSMHALVSR